MKENILILFTVLCVVGCSDKELLDEQLGKAEICFGGGLTFETDKERAATKATFTQAYQGVIAIAQEADWVGRGYDNIGLTVSNGGAMTTTPATVFLDKNKNYNFYSVAVPDGKTMPIRTNYTYPMAFGSDIDLIYATQGASTTSANQLNISLPFKHLYGKVKFVLIAGGGITAAEILSAVITISGYYNQGTLALKGGSITASTYLTGKAIIKDTYYYALPQAISSSNRLTVTVTLSSGEIFTGSMTDTNGSIVQNKEKTISITVKGNQLTFTAAIQDWTTQVIDVVY